MTKQLWAIFALCHGMGVAAFAVDQPEPRQEFPPFTLSIYAEGLQQPDGLAFHPESGELYVSEESVGRISVIRKGHPVPVISGGFSIRDNLTSDMLDDERTRDYWLRNQLVSPEGIAFGPDHHLYVAEDSARGRVLQFEADASGQYRTASVVPLPRLGEPYAWESLCFSKDGGLYLAGSSYEASQSWGYSCVISRDATQGWWMVDYGPLASFSAVTLTEDEQMLIAGDESIGSVTWWDLSRKREMQTLTQPLGSLEGLCMLPDGSVAAAIENTPGHGRVVRIDPTTGAVTVLADGLGTLESVICDPRTGRLYVSEDSSGRILCLTPRTPIPHNPTLLQVARRSSEARRGLPPRETPPFLRQFMSQVGVDLVEQGAAQGAASDASPGGRTAMTLEELGKRIPMIAGRVKVAAMPGVEDPIAEINFLSLYPNELTESEDDAPAPPLCLYAARHVSGKVDRSQIISDLHVGKFNTMHGWETLSQDAKIILPLTTCSATENSNGVTVVMSFLGLGNFGDSFLTINYGRQNDAYFVTSEGPLRVATASFSERGPDGQEILNFAMTGVRTRRVEDATWMPLNPRAIWTLISPGVNNWVSRRTMAVMPDLVARMHRFDRFITDSLLVDDPEHPPSIATEHTPADGQAAAEPTAKEKTDQAARKDLPPLAGLRRDPAQSDEDQNFTNIILSQIVRTWNRGWGK